MTEVEDEIIKMFEELVESFRKDAADIRWYPATETLKYCASQVERILEYWKKKNSGD